MTAKPGKFYRSVNTLFVLIALFNLALTLYSCTQFYAYLPTSDTWIYTDFLAHSAQGQLDIATLFAKHNNLHVIALPKLVYFFDMWLTNGTGALVTIVSLLALLASSAIFIAVISRIDTANEVISQQEKIFLGLVSVILLTSACQVESLLNPANLQWSLLVFSATFTGWFVYLTAQKKTVARIAGAITGIVLVALTSASVLLILMPLAILAFNRQQLIRAAQGIAIIAVIALVVGVLLFSDHLLLAVALFKSWLKFTVDFLAPPVERLHSLLATVFAGALLATGLFALLKTSYDAKQEENIFFRFLLYFSLVVILATGIVRSYSPTAFTFRFVNVGLLFDAALFPLLFLHAKQKNLAGKIITPFIFIYIVLLSYINVGEVAAFGFGRNHMRLTQVAHALDINDPFVVAAMPGTVWEKEDFDYVQANKHKLQEVHTGIYGSDAYHHVGLPIDSLGAMVKTSCQTRIIKMRRLIPEQASYRLLGESKSTSGRVYSHAWFVDNNNIIRGFAIPVMPDKNLFKSLRADKQWAGFVNLALSAEQKSLTLYAYSDSEICQGEKIDLPDYKDLRKKSPESE